MILLYITLICANEVYKSIFLDLKFINPLITFSVGAKTKANVDDATDGWSDGGQRNGI